MPARCMVRGDKKVGAELQRWHFSMSDPIYQVGSHWCAGMPATCESAVKALVELRVLRRQHSVLKGHKVTSRGRSEAAARRRSLDLCIRAIESALRRKGVSR